ncbi:putative WD repeat-containing protein alr3466 OS=Nostoc sp, (strain PCC 7120 / UTEX 2576) GN=alr3466 PE=4 SV=1 [Rhizoctonia solani AG-1 IB]|uniref:Putative WD repeat-containing protein alr3466 n=1 Tax=Thanatephorus cucumeris (strain AG1-IB / isolate 7/3/14) TaxID=1108050 RepID=A0A0B7FDP7_THACB|nr:putative WD repeat-containing protein alr3466 OS=Nostoc sp, (strain PCC 7120 / UTEX 2576) GN=alr3466 PE=4 SV=1 [Rhizoctonia solani AG-1 IB]
MHSLLSLWNRFSPREPDPDPELPKIETGQLSHEGQKGTIYSIVFSPDGKSVVSGSSEKTVCIWDVDNLSPIGGLLRGHTSAVTSVSYSPLGDTIASGSWDGTVRLWNPNTGCQIGQALVMKGIDADINSIAFSPSGKLVASGSDERIVQLWDLHTMNPVADPFKGHSYLVSSVVFTPDETRIVSGSYDKTIRIWGIERGTTVVGPIAAHTQGIRSVCISHDGSQIISGSDDHSLRLWDPRSGEMIGNSFEGHTLWVCSVSLSPNGIYAASGSGDKTVRVWDVRMCRQIGEAFKQHTDIVNSVAFSPCGKRVASCSYDETIKLWDILIGDSTSNHGSNSVFEDVQFLETRVWEPINQHMSVQGMFDLLIRHGCTNLSSEIDTNHNNAILVSGGGFGDIRKGKLRSGGKIAIKTWRATLIEQYDYKTLKRATREIYYWSKMKHENIHQLMGVVVYMGQSLGMVSAWMENGNLHEYLGKCPSANRYQLSLQVASGLAYIHSKDLVHGDIKALNVLVSFDGTAKLTDFGLSTMAGSSIGFSATSTAQAGSIRWVAPELLLEDSDKGKSSDVYALGMTILEIFTGTVPYYPECPRDFQVLLAIQQGILPTRPTNQLPEDAKGNRAWYLLEKCWGREPDTRPLAEEVRDSFSSIES